VEALGQKLGLAGRLILTGLRRDVPELMAAFDVFVLSSLWEGLPRVLPQALATGLPVVATAIDGSAEVIEHGANGLLTPPGEPAALARAVLQLLQDRSLAQRIGEAGRVRAAEFDVRTMADQIVALYDSLLLQKKLGNG
jgi:glycosyltransferase involved in cell wall biosynthesis